MQGQTAQNSADALSSKFRSLGFTRLTEIQKRASPEIFAKKDSLVMAPTGSGKTECAVVPMFARLGAEHGAPGKIRALYITPLRALNRDIFRRIISYAKSEGLSIEIRHGDTPPGLRRKIAASPPDVLITTPETLVILLGQPKMLSALSEAQWVVIDEVHELLPSKRGAQLAMSLERLAMNSRRDITRIGLSATVGNITEAAKFVSGTRRKCRIVRDASVRKYDVDVDYVKGTMHDVADRILKRVAEAGLSSPVLLFSNTRGEAELLASLLKSRSDIPIGLHHGSLSGESRQEAEDELQQARPGIVVCTSSLELGLDIGSVEMVIHYGSPRQVSKMVQRIGRSRHSSGSSARGIIVTNSADDEYEARAILARAAEGSIEEQSVHEGALDVLAHHLVGMTIQLGEVPVAAALEAASAAYPFRGVTLGDISGVLELLDSSGLVRFDRQRLSFGRRGGSFRYHFECLSTIPDILRFRVLDTVGKRTIGSLDQRFIGSYGEQGNVFVLKGSHWRIMSVDEKSMLVNVEPFAAAGTTIPYWEGENIPIDRATAGRVGRFRSRPCGAKTPFASGLMDGLGLQGLPDDRTIVAESSRADGKLVLHACLGTRINATLSALLSSMLSALLGFTVEARSDAYRIVLSSNARLGERLLTEALHDEYDLETVVSASLAGTHNVNWKTWCAAKKFGIVSKGAVYERRAARFLYERYGGTPIVREALRELYHDKFDLDATGAVLEAIRSGQIKVVWQEVDRFSKLAEPILDHASKYYASPASVDKGVLDLVKKRIEKSRHRLVCARCGKWDRSMELREARAQRLVCPYCRGRQIASTFYSDYDLSGVIRKKRAGKRLSEAEQRRFERAWKASSLVENFGITALVVLSGYGIGPDTAARILRNMVDEGGDGLFRQIYEAERQYVMTRGFWDSP